MDLLKEMRRRIDVAKSGDPPIVMNRNMMRTLIEVAEVARTIEHLDKTGIIQLDPDTQRELKTALAKLGD